MTILHRSVLKQLLFTAVLLLWWWWWWWCWRRRWQRAYLCCPECEFIVVYFRCNWLCCNEIVQIWVRPAAWSTCLWIWHAARNAVIQWKWQVPISVFGLRVSCDSFYVSDINFTHYLNFLSYVFVSYMCLIRMNTTDLELASLLTLFSRHLIVFAINDIINIFVFHCDTASI